MRQIPWLTVDVSGWDTPVGIRERCVCSLDEDIAAAIKVEEDRAAYYAAKYGGSDAEATSRHAG